MRTFDEHEREERRERGATAVEYALIIAMIAAIVISAVAFLGQTTSSQFETVNTRLAEEIS